MNNSAAVTLNETGSYGGGVYVTNSGTFTMNGDSLVSDNEAVSSSSQASGGGVYIDGAAFIMNNSAAVTLNKTDSYGGGGVYVTNSGTFTMNGESLVSDNETASSSSQTSGGGVYVNGGAIFEMNDDAAVKDNTSNYSGGGVYVMNGTFTMNDSAAVSSNEVVPSAEFSGPVQGGGVYDMIGGTFTMNDSAAVSGNEATSYGIVVVGGTDVVYGTGEGGGVCVSNGGTFTMNGNAAVSGNTATGGGGGVGIRMHGTFTMNGGAVTLNEAASGGGVFFEGSFIMSGGSVTGNTADDDYASDVVLLNSNYPSFKAGGASTAKIMLRYMGPYSHKITQTAPLTGTITINLSCSPSDTPSDWEGMPILEKDSGHTGPLDLGCITLGNFIERTEVVPGTINITVTPIGDTHHLYGTRAGEAVPADLGKLAAN
jgi:hypothetical protein